MPTGILSWRLLCGPSLALGRGSASRGSSGWCTVRRVGCRHICQIALTYGMVGGISPTRVESCLWEGECRKVCRVFLVMIDARTD